MRDAAVAVVGSVVMLLAIYLTFRLVGDDTKVVDGSQAVGIVAAVLIGLAVYLLPTIVAGARGVRDIGSVAVINIFLGWSIVGWVVALALAARTRTT